ncbi:MAG: tetratricopeptide repeat protein, partial [bacterium]
ELWLNNCPLLKEELTFLYYIKLFQERSDANLSSINLDFFGCEGKGKIDLIEGLYAYRERKYEKSVDRLQQALLFGLEKKKGELASVFVAEALYELKEYNSAKEFYLRTIEYDGEYKQYAKYGLGWTYFRLGELGLATKTLQQLYTESEKDAIGLRARYSVAYFQSQQSNFQECFKEIDNLLKLTKNDEIIGLSRRLFFDTVRRLNDPIKAGDYCISFANRFGKEAYINAINFYYTGKNWTKVKQVCEKVKTLPNLSKKELAIVEFREVLADTRENITQAKVDKLLSLAEKYPGTEGVENFIFEGANFLDSLRLYPDEFALLETFLNYPLSDSLWGEALFLLANTQIKLGEIKKAEKNASRLQNELPKHHRIPELLFHIGEYYRHSGNKTASIDYFKKLVQNYSNHPYGVLAAVQIGDIFFSLKKYGEARDFFLFASQKSANKALKEILTLKITETYFLEGKEELGLSYAKSRIDSTRGENKAYLLSILSDIYFSTGELDSSIKYLKQSLTIPIPAEKKAGFQLKLGELYLRSGNYILAESLFTQVIKESNDDSIVSRARENIARLKEK